MSASSCFRINRVVSAPPLAPLVVELDGKLGRAYELETSAQLQPASWSVVASNPPLGGIQTVRLTNALAPMKQFHRACVTKP